MVTIAELEKQAMQLPDNQRAALAVQVPNFLPAILHDEDEGVAEAMRRDAELARDPSSGQTIQEFRNSLGR